MRRKSLSTGIAWSSPSQILQYPSPMSSSSRHSSNVAVTESGKNWARGGRVYALSAGGLKPVAPMVEKECSDLFSTSPYYAERLKESVARLPVPDGIR